MGFFEDRLFRWRCPDVASVIDVVLELVSTGPSKLYSKFKGSSTRRKVFRKSDQLNGVETIIYG